MSITGFVRPFLKSYVRARQRWESYPEEVQRDQLRRILEAASKTEFGRLRGVGGGMSYEQFASRVPVTPYDEIRPLVMRMISGERDILWPGRTLRYAQSSGTSDGKSKYIPITDESLRRCHYRGATHAVAQYLWLHPESRLFDGKAFILGGSYANELTIADPRVRVGDLSATLIDRINPLANLVRVPSKKIALMEHWDHKLPELVNAAIGENVTNISGVPSWFLTVIRKILAKTGVSNLHEIWPGLEVFFHGGIAFGPYRQQYRELTDPSKMHFMETYNASEGFFAVQTDPDDAAMELLLDTGVFYEFQRQGVSDDRVVPSWEVEKGGVYALVLTACNGLYRYPIGDTVRVVSTDPLKIIIAGRTKCFINAFGEEVMVHNTDAALSRACRDEGCRVADYTAAPVYAAEGHRGRHQWLIEFVTPPADIEEFARRLDTYLQEENSDYQAKREGGIFLDPLTITPVAPGLFTRWLAMTGKVGGQRKVPRLSNDRRILDGILSLIENQ